MIKQALFLSVILISVVIATTACSTDSLPDYTLTIEIIPEGSGTTDPLPGGFDEGANLELEAIPAENYLFERWEGDLTTESNPADLTMNSDKVITAVFKRAPLTLGGDGSKSNPYQVHSLDDLVAIGLEENLDKHYIQGADIDASASFELQNGSGFKFIGDAKHPFTGSYDGNGYSIRNLIINFNKFDQYNGMFGYVKEAVLENITIDNREQLKKLDMSSSASRKKKNQSQNEAEGKQGVGGLVGMNDGGTIKNSHYNGTVIAFLGQATAGFVGINKGVIDNSSFSGSKGGSGSGFVYENYGSINGSSAQGDIEGQGTSGFVRNNYGEIESSYVNMQVTGYIGVAGFVSKNQGEIRSSFMIGTILGGRNSGGFVGDNYGQIENVYVLANLEMMVEDNGNFPPSYEIGGVVGRNDSGGVIRNAFVAGTINIDGAVEFISSFGAFAGENSGMIDHGYWDQELTGMDVGVDQGDPESATGLTTAQMTGPAAEQNMPGFDWVNTWRTTEDGYPALRWQEE